MISIHAPARGATSRTRHARLSKRHFNPRAREGRDWTVYLSPPS